MNRFVVKSISVLAVAPFPVPVTVAFPEEEEVRLISTSPDESVVPEEALNVPRSVVKSTVALGIGFPAASLRIAVMVEAVDPSAKRLSGSASRDKSRPVKAMIKVPFIS